MCRNENKKSQKLPPLYKMVKNLPVEASPPKVCFVFWENVKIRTFIITGSSLYFEISATTGSSQTFHMSVMDQFNRCNAE